jgi:hypothetical protein
MRGCVLGVLTLAGCLSAGGGANSPAASEEVRPVAAAPVVAEVGPVAAAPVRRERIEVICARAVRCGTIGRSQLEECRKGPDASRLTLVWGYDAALGIPVLVAQGRLKPIAGADAACLEFLATAPCRYERTMAPPGCDADGGAPLTANVAPGGKCTRWEECVDGFCTAQVGCEGVCKARARRGEACGDDRICDEHTYCERGTCKARADVGAECGGHWQWCRDGLVCDGYSPPVENEHHSSPGTKGRCSVGRGEGEACVPQRRSDELCAPGLVCDWGVDKPVCRRPLAAGDECGWADACGDGLVCAGLVLGGLHPSGQVFAARRRGRCAPVLDAGDACDPQTYVSGCPGSMLCDERTRVCRSRGHAGDPCVSSWITKPTPSDAPLRNDGCFSGHYCEVATRTCKRQLGRGERCVPQKSGVEDEPCFLGECDARTRRCVVACNRR